MNNRFLPNPLYKFIFALLGLVYVVGLFVPLIDNDSAHHACIALRMHFTGDYASLIDQGGDYLDKPHLHFWLCAFSYKVFGINSFAYKFPSFLFTILGTYSTYRLGKTLYNNEIGKLAALILATSFAYIVAVSDVRMDAILTATIALSTWQLIEFVNHKRLSNISIAALGLAMAFSTKGHIGVFVPAVATLFYILYRKEYSIFWNWKWLLMLLLFGLFISPVLYAYYLQYNLHPEKIIRGQDHINGVKFILFNQSVERFNGGMGGDSKNDYLFFIHSFLWAFAPWSIIAFLAVGDRIKNIFRRKEEWATTACFTLIILIVSFSSFKLPHYLNIVFPVAAVMTAVFIFKKQNISRWVKALFICQYIIAGILLLLAAFINGWAFGVKHVWIILVVVLFLSLVFYFLKTTVYSALQKIVLVPVAAMLLFFFLMNSNFFPQLLSYQAGKNLAALTKGKVNPEDVYFQKNSYSYSSSYTFYTKSIFKTFNDSMLHTGRRIWIQTEPVQLENLKKDGYQIGEVYSVPHFRITKLNLNFLNPGTRDKEASSMMLAEILSKK